MATYGFSEGDAKRIGKAVRLVERGADKIRLGGPGGHGATPGVRLLIARHSGSTWATGSTAVVTVYNGDPGSVASALTLVAYNHYVELGTDTSCTNRWVALGHNGWAWHVIDSHGACNSTNATCSSEVQGINFATLPGYAATNVQMLGHDAGGCIKWFDVTTCATA